MKEIERKDLPEVGGGVWSDDGCIPGLTDPTRTTTDLLLQLPPESAEIAK